jgi:hypothetical protein
MCIHEGQQKHDESSTNCESGQTIGRNKSGTEQWDKHIAVLTMRYCRICVNLAKSHLFVIRTALGATSHNAEVWIGH